MLAPRLLRAGLRLPTSLSATCLASSPEAFPLRSHVGASSHWQQSFPPYHQSSSSAAPPETVDLKCGVLELPPNLKIDPRAKSSPFYGANRFDPEEKKRMKRALKKSDPLQTEANTSASAVALGPTDKNAHDDDDPRKKFGADTGHERHEHYDYGCEEGGEHVLYDISTRPDVPRAVPLPQRLHVPVMDIKTGEKVGTFHLSETTFGNDPVRVDILHRIVVWQRNKKRGKRNAGARTKTVSEVSGSGRKVRRQKGTGMARAGHSRPAHWRGGAKAHGPKGRVQDYTTKLNKKVRKMGVRHALSQKLKEGNLIVTGDMAVPTHKTKELDIMLKRFGISGKNGATALMCDDADSADIGSDAAVYGGLDINFKVACGNLPKVKLLNQKGCHVYSMLKFRKLVLSLAAVRGLEERLERDL